MFCGVTTSTLTPAFASVTRSSPSPHTSFKADAVAPSIAADDDSPAPTGTSEANARSTPQTDAASTPVASSSAHATPSGYRAHSTTSLRRAGKSASRSARATSTASVSPAKDDETRMRPSSRVASRTLVRCSIANGRTKPSL